MHPHLVRLGFCSQVLDPWMSTKSSLPTSRRCPDKQRTRGNTDRKLHFHQIPRSARDRECYPRGKKRLTFPPQGLLETLGSATPLAQGDVHPTSKIFMQEERKKLMRDFGGKAIHRTQNPWDVADRLGAGKFQSTTRPPEVTHCQHVMVRD